MKSLSKKSVTLHTVTVNVLQNSVDGIKGLEHNYNEDIEHRTSPQVMKIIGCYAKSNHWTSKLLIICKDGH